MITPRSPAPLPRPARALLASYRDAHEIPEAARDRIWSVVGAEDAPAPAYDPFEHEGRGARRREALAEPRDDVEPSRSGSSGNVRWLAWGTATLAAAAVLVLAWQLGGTLAERRQASRTPGAAVMQGGGGSPQGRASAGARDQADARPAAPPPAVGVAADPTASPELSRPADGSGALDPSRAAGRSEAPSSTARSSASGRPTSSRPEPPRSPPDRDLTEPGSTLAAERELVARAWRALALGETAPALDAAAEHARRFPAGLLAPERAAIDTIARCRRGDADGPRRATAFHREHAGSPLAKRVDEACVAAPKE